MHIYECGYEHAQRTDDIFIFKIYIVRFMYFSLSLLSESLISLERLFPSWSNLNSIKSHIISSGPYLQRRRQYVHAQ